MAQQSGLDPRADEILTYWLGEKYMEQPTFAINEECKKKWFFGGPTVDEEIKTKFGSLLPLMATGQLDSWLDHPLNGLAGVILMDQFSRNIFRNDKQTFALDPKACSWAKTLLDSKKCDSFPITVRLFLLYPLDHSEELHDQERCVQLINELVALSKEAVSQGNTAATPLYNFLVYAAEYLVAHRDVIAQWGRFPHRNQILGRESTPEEIAGLAHGTIRKF